MKNFISYYYGLNIDNIYFSNDRYIFNSGKERYALKLCYNSNFSMYYQELNGHFNEYHLFFTAILNRQNSYITWIENKPYILLKLSNIENHKLSIYDIRTDLFIKNVTNLSIVSRFPWIKLWEDKIDYFEDLVSSKYGECKKIYPLFHYFIGIAENALLYLKESDTSEKRELSDDLVVAHDRVTLNYRLYDYYDPTNIILDHSSRDVSEYIKSMFLNRMWDLDLVKDYLGKHYFSRYGLRVLFARVLFPSFFFDYLEEMITNNNEIDLLYLENRADEFQNFIKDIGLFLNEKYNIPIIPWIIKKI